MKVRPLNGWVMALVVAVIAGAIAWNVLRDSGAPQSVAATPPPVAPLEFSTVDIAPVERRVLSRSLPLSGSLSPVVQATVKSKVSGEVQQVTVREGQDVQESEVIARIDTRNLRAQYDRELAAVEKARADLDLATLNRDKNRSLLEKNFISQNTYESTESAYAGSVAGLKLAEAQARLARISLDDAVIRAPFAGTVARRLVQPGEKVSTDAAIVSLVDLSQMWLEAPVPASDIPDVRVGQKVRFGVNGFGDREFHGQVQRINPVTMDGSRAITVYVAVGNDDGSLKGGMFAQGELTLHATDPVLAVPQTAIHQAAGESYVYALQNGKIARKPITLGAAIKGEEFAEVRDGLQQGDSVIVAQISEENVGRQGFVNDLHTMNSRLAEGGTE